MRNSFLIPLCLIFGFLFSGFNQQSDPETLHVIQKSLELEQLQRILEKDDQGNFLPIQLISNEYIGEDANLFREGQKVDVYASESSARLDNNRKFLALEDLKIKEKKSVLKFMYDENLVKIKLRKAEDQWLFRSILIKNGKGSYYLDVEIEK